MREALHPLDQFRAFKNLHEQGLNVDIGGAVFVSAQVVRQRLKLAAASPKLTRSLCRRGIVARASSWPFA